MSSKNQYQQKLSEQIEECKNMLYLFEKGNMSAFRDCLLRINLRTKSVISLIVSDFVPPVDRRDIVSVFIDIFFFSSAEYNLLLSSPCEREINIIRKMLQSLNNIPDIIFLKTDPTFFLNTTFDIPKTLASQNIYLLYLNLLKDTVEAFVANS